MFKTEFSDWRKLDNAALAFPAVTDKKDTRVFRFYCQLKETVNPDLLQQALDIVMKKYPMFQSVLRKGLFWFYLEHREIHALVKKEERPPCSRIYIPDSKSLLFEVTYSEDCINLEVFHGLTDGTGAMQFLQELVKNYLWLSYPQDQLPDVLADELITGTDMEEDSFSQYYSAEAPRSKGRKKPAYQLKGEKLEQQDMHIMEIIVPVDKILERARTFNVSITVFLASALLCAIHEEVPKFQMGKPIGLMIPVNLRNYFPSRSMANFFGWIEVSYKFQDDTEFEDVLVSVKEQFSHELSKERISMRLNELVSLEKNPFLRAVPLEIKQFFLHAGATLGGKSITAVFSNIGVIKLHKQYEKYIQRFGIMASTDSLQMCACSYGNELVLECTSKVPNDNIQRNFLRILQGQNLPFKQEEKKFPGYREKSGQKVKMGYRIFTFISLFITIICGMVDYIAEKKLTWAWFVAAGCLCMWVIVSMAIKKRRNLLKNLMWQFLFISAAGLIWDGLTGWHGWSADFLLPLAQLAVLGAIPVIAYLCHMAREDYLYYLMQACIFGLIPLILLLVGVVTVPGPSVISGGLSILAMSGLFIFMGKNVKKEIRKKLRM